MCSFSFAASLPVATAGLQIQIVADNAAGHESPERFRFECQEDKLLGRTSNHSNRGGDACCRWDAACVVTKEQPKCPQRRRAADCDDSADAPMKIPCRTSSLDLEDLIPPKLELWSRTTASSTNGVPPPPRPPSTRVYRSPPRPRSQRKQVFSKSA